MRLSPTTKLASLLTAIPSSKVVLGDFDIAIIGNESKTLEQLCTAHGITFQNFEKALNELNWDDENGPRRN